MATLRHPRFALYLTFVCLSLGALALAGPAWFVVGLCGFTAIEIATTLRTAEAQRQIQVALARNPRR